MAPIAYQENCARCHPLFFDERIEQAAPHAKPEAVRAFVQQALLGYIQQHPGDISKPDSAFRRVPLNFPRPAGAAGAQRAGVGRAARRRRRAPALEQDLRRMPRAARRPHQRRPAVLREDRHHRAVDAARRVRPCAAPDGDLRRLPRRAGQHEDVGRAAAEPGRLRDLPCAVKRRRVTVLRVPPVSRLDQGAPGEHRPFPSRISNSSISEDP